MVGDSAIDFATAKAAGVPSIGVTFGYTPQPVRAMVEFRPAAIIDDFGEFLAALQQVLASR
jgi:phosphoglycolate phosphatase